uniref:CSON006434 protein n=1 Tax=Culicoides sonorensis TaxID=179676 RepID=A0A336LZT7_CULSO
MDGMEDTGDDTQAQDSQPEEEHLTTEDITSEFFEETTYKLNNILKDLHPDQHSVLIENGQRLLLMAQCYRQSYLDEKENVAKMQLDIEKSAQKVAQAMKVSQADQDTIQNMKAEIDDAWKLADAAQIREQEAQESMYAMREKLEKLQKEAEKTADRGDDEMGGSSMMKHKENLLRDRDRLQSEVEDLSKRMSSQKIYIEDLEKKRDEHKTQIKDLVKQLDELTNEAFKEKRLLESTQNQLKDVTLERDIMAQEIKNLKEISSKNHRTILQQQLQIGAHKANLEKQTATLNVNAIKLAKFASDLDSLAQLKEKVTNELNTKLNLIKMKEDENNKFRLENSKLMKQKEAITKKLVTTIGIKTGLEQEVVKLKNLIVNFEKEREANKKALDQARKFSENIIRERDIVRKDLVKSNSKYYETKFKVYVNFNVFFSLEYVNELKDQIILNEQQQKTMENDLRSRTISEHKLKSLLVKAEKEREKLLEETQNINEKLLNATDEINSKQTLLNSQKEKINELQQKINQLQQQYETVKTERATFQRELQNCVDERNDLKERLKASLKDVEQLREDISSKDMEMVRAHKLIEKTEKDKTALKAEIQTTIIALQHAKTELQELKVQNGRFQKTILDDEENMNKIKKRLDTIIHEKDVVGTQLIRKNDEINNFKEKISIMQLALDRGENQYTKRLDDIRLLKIEIKNLRSQRNLLTRGLANTSDMRQEVLQLNRTLTQERVKAKALEMEMLTPMNVHRWRKLCGKDPEKIELIEKVQNLQKRILNQSVEATDRENDLHEYQNLYASLKGFVLKIPGHDIKERLNSTQRSLTAKTRKIKSLAAELNTKEEEIKLKDISIEDLKKNLQKTKTELSDLKKKEQNQIIEFKGDI